MEQTLATIMGWGATFSPRGWAFCHGQLLAISSNDALFSLIGTIYGGDGRTTFALPDLRGRGPVGFGQSPGTSFWPIGARVGSEDEVLTQLSLPVHNHSAQLENATMPLAASSNDGTTGTPSGNEVFAAPRVNAGALNTLALAYADAGDADTTPPRRCRDRYYRFLECGRQPVVQRRPAGAGDPLDLRDLRHLPLTQLTRHRRPRSAARQFDNTVEGD